jgi:hypothetical protein
MDAMNYIVKKNAAAITAEDRKAVCIALANALRDMADEIEAGVRIVTELQTQESTKGNASAGSILFLRSVLKK